MIENFQQHRSDFDALISMFKEDRKLGRVGSNFTRTTAFFTGCEPNSSDCPNGPDDIGVTASRLEDYRKRFAELGIESGIEGYEQKEQIYLHASSLGLSISGTSKGYLYADSAPPIVVNDLDSYRGAEDGRSVLATKHIDGNWYLYLDY